jgi:signal transduction histidine kinase
MTGFDPLVHSVFWSLLLNASTLAIVSMLTSQNAVERIQATIFANLLRHPGARPLIRASATTNDLFFVAQRVLGAEKALALFRSAGPEAGTARPESEPTPAFIDRLERELAGSIGAASAHVMLSKVVSGDVASLEEVMQMADETQQAIEYSQQLERTSAELRSTARKLERANRQLRELDTQKDEFLSQVSHEVRTPMTSIRSFAEILLDSEKLDPAERARFISTIHAESLRLTRLLDEILDLSALERGERGWENVPFEPEPVLDRAIEVCCALAMQRSMRVFSGRGSAGALVAGEPDRLSQVVINLISNAIKYNDAPRPVVEIRSRTEDGRYVVEVADNGPGIPKADRRRIFEKFARGQHGVSEGQPGAGLGLAISRQIVERMGGRLDLVADQKRGACFRVSLPLVTQARPARTLGEAL